MVVAFAFKLRYTYIKRAKVRDWKMTLQIKTIRALSRVLYIYGIVDNYQDKKTAYKYNNVMSLSVNY